MMVTEPKILNALEKQSVVYCIPTWLRDEQILLNIKEVSGRLSTDFKFRDEPIAIVCFGPSLQDTWEEVKKFNKIITCSGAHRFLIDRGIIPTYHIEVDPRPHKIKLLGEPHPDVEYLIASSCHPDYFKHLKGFNVKLWHAFDANDEPMRILPPGDWALTGGCDAGLRAMTVARFIGYREQHIFGKDGNQKDNQKHASEHPMEAPQYSIVKYPDTVDGIEYKTTPAFLEAARGTFHEMDQMPDVSVKFYGEGLVQAMAKDYVRKAPLNKLVIAINKPELISAELRDLNSRLHRDKVEFGVGGGKHAPQVIKLKEAIKAKSILDYGCGKGYLAKALPFPIWEYDPAIPGKDASPRPADLVICTDVLEHVEKDKLFFVLDDLRRCTLKIGYFIIHLGPAVKTYADGRNTHLIQKSTIWWRDRLEKFFKLGDLKEVGKELRVVAEPRPSKKLKLNTMTVEN